MVPALQTGPGDYKLEQHFEPPYANVAYFHVVDLHQYFYSIIGISLMQNLDFAGGYSPEQNLFGF